MQNFVEKKALLSDDEVNELLYYYKHGIEVGKEEILIKVINNMVNMSFSMDVISKVVDKKPKEVKLYIN